MDPDREADRATVSTVGGVPRRVSHYEILSEIGRGGMGVVYHARNLSLDLDVALKCPSRDLAFHPRHLHRFTREARTLARLSHPNIVRVHDAFEEDGVPWVVLDLVDGTSLRDLLGARDGPLPYAEVLQHTVGLAGALEAAHSHRIVHRDVTPGNVLIGRDGTARLTDFGLARWYAPVDEDGVESTAGLLSTQRGTVVGTPAYMSPEQIIGDRLDGRSDLFSLGVVAYEMATGHSPFRPEGNESVRQAILQRQPEPMSRASREVSKEFERIIEKTLAKNRDDRYQDAAELLEDLKALGGERAPPTPVPRPPRRWAGISAVALFAVTIACAVGWWWYQRPPTLPDWNARHLTTDPAVEFDPAVSPDGTLVVFASDRAGNADLWLVDTRGGEPRQLTFDPGPEYSPAWFPDGSSIAFTTEREDRPSIWKTPRLGGSALPLIADARDPAVSPSGRQIAFASIVDDGGTRIAVAASDGSDDLSILSGGLDTVGDHRWPAWSPDGDRIAFNDGSDVWVVNADGSNPIRLTEGPNLESRPCWSSDGRQIYYASQRGGTIGLWAATVRTGTSANLTPGTGPERSPGISRNGSVLAYSSLLRDSDLIVLNRESGTHERVSGSRVEGAPTMAPDGSAVVYGCDRLDTWDLWLQPLRGGVAVGEIRRLTDLPGSIAVPQFSPDGRSIVFAAGIQEEWDLWEVPVAGGQPRRLTDRPGREVHPRLSPDSKRLAFVSRYEGEYHIWIAPYADGRLVGEPEPWTIGAGPGRFPEWSPDGSRIAFLCRVADVEEVCVAPTDLPDAGSPITDGSDARFARWDRASGKIAVAGTWGTARVHLRWVDPDGGGHTPFEPAVTMGGSSAYGDFDISADGRYVVYDRDESRGDIWILKAQEGRF